MNGRHGYGALETNGAWNLSKTPEGGFAATPAVVCDRPGAGRMPAFAGVTAKRDHISAKAIGSFLPKLTRKAFEKYGFAAATLLTDWSRIVGPDIARYTQPDRIKWPKGVAAYGELEAGAEGRPGATLMLKVDPARAMDVEYRRAQLIERINGYFGYRAIVDIRIVQAPLLGSEQRPSAALPARPRPQATPPQELVCVADEPLRAALATMQAGIAGRRAARG